MAENSFVSVIMMAFIITLSRPYSHNTIQVLDEDLITGRIMLNASMPL